LDAANSEITTDAFSPLMEMSKEAASVTEFGKGNRISMERRVAPPVKY
jgi:hypothetical protein